MGLKILGKTSPKKATMVENPQNHCLKFGGKKKIAMIHDHVTTFLMKIDQLRVCSPCSDTSIFTISHDLNPGP